MELHRYSQEAAWSNSSHVYYIPFVGPDYDLGLDGGVRVLILGDSLYGDAEKAEKLHRDCNLEEFMGYLDLAYDCNVETKRFYKALPRIVTRKVDPSGVEAVQAWRRVAFANAVQSLVPKARKSPTAAQYKEAVLAVGEMLDVLKPHVVLVLGKRLWNKLEMGEWSDEPPIGAKQENRKIWLMKAGEDYARVTWIFHPSTYNEDLPSAIGVMQQLIERAGPITGA